VSYLDEVTTDQWLQSIWVALRRIEDNMALPPAPLELPAPQVTVTAPDLTDLTQKLMGLQPGPTALELARAIADVLPPSVAKEGSPSIEMYDAIVRALERLDFRLQAPPSQGYIGGSVNLQAGQTVGITGPVTVSSTFQSNQAGTWAYYAGVSGTVNVTAGQRVLGIAAHATTAGSMTINGGASVPIPAGTGIQFTPMGNLVAPAVVLTGTDSYVIEVVNG
jgi:hypothetical protein